MSSRFSTLWLLYDVQDIFDRGRMEGIQTVLALIIMVGAIEFTRRATGLIIPIPHSRRAELCRLVGPHAQWRLPFFSGLTLDTLFFRSDPGG